MSQLTNELITKVFVEQPRLHQPFELFPHKIGSNWPISQGETTVIYVSAEGGIGGKSHHPGPQGTGWSISTQVFHIYDTSKK